MTCTRSGSTASSSAGISSRMPFETATIAFRDLMSGVFHVGGGQAVAAASEAAQPSTGAAVRAVCRVRAGCRRKRRNVSTKFAYQVWSGRVRNLARRRSRGQHRACANGVRARQLSESAWSRRVGSVGRRFADRQTPGAQVSTRPQDLGQFSTWYRLLRRREVGIHG